MHRSFFATFGLGTEKLQCSFCSHKKTAVQMLQKNCEKNCEKTAKRQNVAEKLRKNCENTAKTEKLHCSGRVVTVSVYTATHTPRLATTCSPPYLYDHPQGLLGRVGHMICLFLHTRAPMAKQNHSNYDGKRILCGKWASDGRIS